MVDFAMDVHKNLYPDQDIPTSLLEKRKSVVEKLKGLQENTEKIQKIFEDDEVVKMIQNARDGRVLFESLQKSHDFQPEMVDKLYEYAKFQFECGNYTAASEYLYFCRVLLPANIPQREVKQLLFVDAIEEQRITVYMTFFQLKTC